MGIFIRVAHALGSRVEIKLVREFYAQVYRDIEDAEKSRKTRRARHAVPLLELGDEILLVRKKQNTLLD